MRRKIDFSDCSIKKKLLILLPVIFIPTFILIVTTSFRHRTQELKTANNKALLMVNSLAAQQEKIVSGTKQMLSTLSQLPEVINFDVDACNRLLAQLNERYPFYSVLAGATPDGNMFTASIPFKKNSINLSDRKHVKDAVNTLEFSAGEYITGRASKVDSINFAYPVVDQANKIAAIIVAGVRLDQFLTFINSAHLPEGSVVSIADYKGIRMFRFPETDASPVGKFIPTLSREKISNRSPEGIFENLSEDGVYRIYAYKQLRLNDYAAPYMCIFVGIPKDKILAEVNQEMMRGLVVLLVTVLFSIVLIWILVDFVLVKPINRLVKATIQFGLGDMNTRTLLPHSANELGKLAKSFDDMASLLAKKEQDRQSAEDELKHAYETLEQRVQDRTSELAVSNQRLAQEIIEREHAEQALVMESTRRRIMFEQSPDGILIMDTCTKRFLDFNTAAHTQLGYSREEFALLSLGDIEAMETEEETERRIADVQHHGHADFETLHRTRQGEIRNVHVTAQTIHICGEVVYHCTWRDITERKQTELDLLREQLFGKALLNSLPGIFYVYTYPDLRLVRWNENHERLLGFEHDELMHRSIFDWHVPELRERVREAVDKVMLQGQGAMESLLLAKDGRGIPFLLTGAQVEFSGQAYLIGVGIDITERKQAEAALLESEKKHRLMFESANDSIFLCDIQGKLLDANPMACQRLGYTHEELVTMMVNQVDAPGEQQYLAERLHRIWQDGHYTFESSHQRKDGSIVSAEVSAWLITSEGQSVIMSTCRDITERKRAEEEKKQLQTQLIQAQKMQAIGTLAGGIAHDFNNILGGILGYTELARSVCPAGSKVVEYLDKELEAIHRASQLVRQILTFSRQTDSEQGPLSLENILKEVLQLLRPTLPSTISIKHDIKPTKPIMANSSQMHQVIMNLCTNAFHAMEQTGGTLSIALKDCEFSEDELPRSGESKSGAFVAISIGDSGPGIPSASVSRIFEPYFTTKEIGKGSGMGLAIVHGIVQQHGGMIHVESELGIGTVFHVYFPALKDQEPAPMVEDEQTFSGGSEHILLIDDEPFLVEMGQAILEKMGYRVTTKTNSQEALIAFQAHHEQFDVVITDQTMPIMTGVELAQKFLDIRPDIPIILCTGYSSQVSQDIAQARGIREFAMKPLTMHGIATLLRKVLEK